LEQSWEAVLGYRINRVKVRSRLVGIGVIGIALLCAVLPAAAAAEDAEADRSQDEIVVYGRAIEQIGIAQSGSQGIVGYKDFENRPLGRVGELVENVPGVIATQHSGTGKANQYFLRGFNLDHGTDFAGFVDGVPINMRTHGHGQGYLDFNFLIPELVERIDYAKGPYAIDAGDFSAAGTIRFKTVDRLARPFAEAVVGEFGYYRALAAGSTNVGAGDLLLGAEATTSNGVWDLDENLEKFNGLVRYSQGTDARGFSVGLTGYDASWRSTDQIPERAIRNGIIGRFGNIDPDLLNTTTRFGLIGEANLGATQLTAFATYYRLRLNSNFTYFLEDPVNGDQFQQRDRRGVFGGSLHHSVPTTVAGRDLKLRFGADLRYDAIATVGLYRSTRSVRRETIREDKVDEYSAAVWAEGELTLAPNLRATLGLRYDVLGYEVNAGLAANSGNGADTILTPKAALAWRLTKGLELYANYGESYHSNDVRGATINVDPVTGAPAERVPVFARARGYEFGARIETDRFNATLVGYFLSLQSELVFVGDAGTTEPNDASRRYGVEAAAFWRPTDWLTFDASAALTNARFRGVDLGARHIPGAVDEVLSGGLSAALGNGFTLTTRVRHFGAAPLIEDNSVRSDPTTLVNLGGYFSRGRVRIGIDILNLLNARDADITYFYASQLLGEANPVEDRHLHPVEPRQLRASLRVSF
jgi:outer membrane receptor protein involved in Fe transport